MSKKEYADEYERYDVFFPSNGQHLAGHLYRPINAAERETPALISTGPIASVKEQTLPHYACPLAANGYTVLTFDYRNFGESGGEPRQHLHTSEQVEDIKNAISYMAGREDIDSDRIGLNCVGLSAGYAVEVAVIDRRIAAVALTAGCYNICDTYVSFLGEDGFDDYLEKLSNVRQRQYKSDKEEYIQIVADSSDSGPAAMPTREFYEYYTNTQGTIAPSWKNRITIQSMEYIVGWNTVRYAHLIDIPLLVIHGTADVLSPPKYAEEIYEQAKEPKKLHWIKTDNHVQLYNQEPYVSEAIKYIANWFNEHLTDNGRKN